MNEIVNAAFQVIPGKAEKTLYQLVDVAIKEIRDSGLTCRVCPFETVVEGPLEEVLALVPRVLKALYAEGVEDVLTFMKLQSRKGADVSIGEKMEGYGG